MLTTQKTLPWSFTPERIAAIQKQIDRGCGFMTFHFAAYIPYKFQQQGLAWNGGYVEYELSKLAEELVFLTV
jgi:hypothetical protein